MVRRERTSGSDRLDVLVHERGLAASREKARALIIAGEVSVDGQTTTKPSTMVRNESVITVREHEPYVSRGGHKLAHALETFGIDVAGKVALDAGASTGGFTDVLLQRGAARVYAVDVGYGQLAWRLRQDRRVVVMERTNVRHLQTLPEKVGIVTGDLSFISLTLVLERLSALASEDAKFVLLVKPQFEAGKSQVGKGGVVRDHSVRRAVLEKVVAHARGLGLSLQGLTPSPVLGPAGNVEFLAWFERRSGPISDGALIDQVIRESRVVESSARAGSR